jgi:hypothetical protein
VALPAALRLTLAVTLDGVPLSGFPVERRPTGTQIQQSRVVRPAADITLRTPPVSLPATTVLLQVDHPLLVSLNAQDADAITLAAGGALFLLGATLTGLQTANRTIADATMTVMALS